MEFRIGVNLGDVTVEGDRSYGEGINIAARPRDHGRPPTGMCSELAIWPICQTDSVPPRGCSYNRSSGRYASIAEPRDVGDRQAVAMRRSRTRAARCSSSAP
jgi:hypothetical protein